MSQLNIIDESKNRINRVSYLNSKETSLFSISSSKEYFFGSSVEDVIEVGIYNNQRELSTFTVISGSSSDTKVFYQYEDVDANIFTDYFNSRKNNLIQDGEKNVLISIEDIVNSQSITSDNFYLSLNPVSNIFSQKNPLTIKEISNSRKEVKLIKSFKFEKIYDYIKVTFDGDQILFDGKQTISIKHGTVYTLKIHGNIDMIRFSKTKDGKLYGGSEFVGNIVYKNSIGEIILDTTEYFPDVLFAYNKNKKNNGVKIISDGKIDTKLFRLNTEFLSLSPNNFINKRIYDDVDYYINLFNLTDRFESSKLDFRSNIESLKKLFVLTDDAGVLDFVKSIYFGDSFYDAVLKKQIKMVGMKDYILNYFKFNFEFINNFDSLRVVVNNINVSTCNKRLLLKNPNANLTNSNKIQYQESLRYLVSLFNDFLTYTFLKIETDFKNKFKSPLKNSLNFGGGKLYNILNSKLEDAIFYVKLNEPLPNDISVGDLCDVSNTSIEPFFQNVTFENVISKNTIKLSNPNFSIDLNEPSSKTQATKYLNLNQLEIDRDIDNKISLNKKTSELNVDYTSFYNFVIFSSSNLRLKIFKNKIIKLFLLNANIDLLNEIDPLNSSVNDTLDVYNKIKNDKEEVDSIIDSFDGFESYLYKTGKFIYNISLKKFVENTSSTVGSSFVEDMESDSLEYDKNNRDSLLNNTPEYILSDDENDEYLKFLSMIGHHFDNIYLYISNIGIYKKMSHAGADGITEGIVRHMLNSFGFSMPPGLTGNLENEEIAEKYLSKSESTEIKNSLSINEKVKTIWKRMLINLPSIYKTKGTHECLRQIFSIYGIPNNLILVKEFGGGYTRSEINSTYLLEEKTNLLEFMGTEDEFVECVNLPIYKSIDFKLYIDSSKYKTSNVIVPIHDRFSINGDHVYSFGFIKINKKLGSFYFIIKKGDVSFATITDPLYLFGDEVLSVMLRKNDVDERFEESVDISSIPTKYDICVHRNEYCLETIDKKFSFYLSGSLNTAFESGSELVSFGNVDPQLNIISELGNLFLEQRGAVLESEENFDSASIANMLIVTETPPYQIIYGSISDYTVSKFYGCLDKFTFQSVPLSDENFHLKCKNFNYYYQGQPSSSYDDIVFRFELGPPVDISYSSSLDDGYKVGNANKKYPNSYSLLYNFEGSNSSLRVASGSCISELHSYYPHQTKNFDITNEYFTGEVGPNRFENNKINHVSLNMVGDTLSPVNSLTFKNDNNFYKDTNKLGIFISPIHEINKDILNFFGDYEIVSSISDPRERFGRRYYELCNLRNHYYGDDYTPKVLFNELFKIYKLYIDKSIFDTIKNVLPSRNKIYSGILIEPTILERNRIENKPVFIGEVSVLSSSINLKDILNDVDNGEFIEQRSSVLPIISYSKNLSFVNTNFCGFECMTDVPDKYMNNIFVNPNGSVNLDGKLYVAYKVNNIKTISYSSNNIISSNVNVDFYNIQLVLSGSNFTTASNYELLTDLRDIKHISRKNLPFRKEVYRSAYDVNGVYITTGRSRQTNLTTIGEGGAGVGGTGGSGEPVILTKVGNSIKSSQVVSA